MLHHFLFLISSVSEMIKNYLGLPTLELTSERSSKIVATNLTPFLYWVHNKQNGHCKINEEKGQQKKYLKKFLGDRKWVRSEQNS